MRTAYEIAHDIIRREGGFVNDPDDPGGATKYGVTLSTLQRLKLDLTDDDAVDIQDVRALTRAQAMQIFVEHYFYAPQISQLPDILHAPVFDMYVNAGANAIKVLQKLLVQMGQPVTVDGTLGPQSISAAYTAARQAPEHFADAYSIARRNYYFRLADARPASRKYARTQRGGKGGWIRRAEEFMAPRYHMSTEQFQKRVQKWG